MIKKALISIVIAICLVSCICFLFIGCRQKDERQTLPSNNTIQSSSAENDNDNHTKSPIESTEAEQIIETNNELSNICKPSTGDFPGNSMSSLMNAGIFATDGEWDYILLQEYAYSDIGLYKISIDGKECVKLTDHSVYCINLVEDWIYYCIYDEGIYRLKKDGSLKEQIFNGKCYGMLIIGETIYFSNELDEYKIYSMDTNGHDLKVFIDKKKSHKIQWHNSYLLFSHYDQTVNVYLTNIQDVSQIEKLAENVWEYIVYNDCIYYLKYDEYKLYKKNIGESQSRIISDGIDTRFFIENDKIYFTSATSEDQNIYTMDLDGNNITEFYNGRKNSYPVGDIYGVVRDTVYYSADNDAGKLIRINNDGSITMAGQIINTSEKIDNQ